MLNFLVKPCLVSAKLVALGMLAIYMRPIVVTTDAGIDWATELAVDVNCQYQRPH
jgi:hypothetical protein